MRQIVLDTETTGLEVSAGHRIIEIGCVELLHRRRTGRHWHRYLKPGREVDPGALAVHGITNEFLAAQPSFAEVAAEFLAFVDGAELVIHNAEFDVGFLEAELALAGIGSPLAARCRVCDTLTMARRMHPGQRNSLDALCKRYNVDNSGRDLHGALKDARLLADVYLAMSGGQAALGLDALPDEPGAAALATPAVRGKLRITVVAPTPEELAAHERELDAIDRASGGRTLFRAGGARGA
ncbi:MAG TPA: DNA polymerase III subunit epsilon [Steroidobacteraceae bacterium]|nr:DNA polymerase III subunit epsilon [Steroidobacteraceae bacterium]